MIEKKDVTSAAALKYIKEKLSRGGLLSECINELPLDNGSVYAFVPEAVPKNKLYDFENGGLYPIDEDLLADRPPSTRIPNDARPCLTEIIQQHLKERKANCCLFEDPIRMPMDPITITSDLDYVHLSGRQIFYFFNHNKNDTIIILKALLASEADVFLCVLGSLEIAMQNEFLPNSEIGLNLLNRFADSTSSFFVNAYDHEGFLMWFKG